MVAGVFPFLWGLVGGGLAGATDDDSGIFRLLDRRPEGAGCDVVVGLFSVTRLLRFREVAVGAGAVGTSAAAAGAAGGAGADDWAARLAA
jgi:hypothetical protein